MNAERLHVIVRAIRDEIQSPDLIGLLEQISENLTTQDKEPDNQNFQKVTSDNLRLLYGALEGAASNEFSPAWEQFSLEIGAHDLLGSRLQVRLQNIFERNQITPAVARDELEELLAQVRELNSAVSRVSEGFEHLKIGAEELNPGECEVGVLIPRSYVRNNLDTFSGELDELDFIFKTFAEVATGARPALEIRTISSSDLTVFLSIPPQVAAFVATAVEEIVSLYKSLLKIRKLRAELMKQDIPEDRLGGIEDHVNNLMNNGIESLAGELVDKHFNKSQNVGRKNELRNGLKAALKKIAGRIDNGFNIEIRIEPMPEDDDKRERSAKEKDLEEHVSTIRAASKNLQFINLEGDPILHLPETEEEGK